MPIDRELIELVWGPDGYPARAPYRDEHHRTARDHKPWANDGAIYDPARALAQVRADAAELAERCARRVAGGGLCTLAFDTELFGHHWHEGPAFLTEFAQACAARGVPLVHLDDALEDAARAPWPDGLDARDDAGASRRRCGPGRGRRSREIARAQRAAELRVIARGRRRRAARAARAARAPGQRLGVPGDARARRARTRSSASRAIARRSPPHSTRYPPRTPRCATSRRFVRAAPLLEP